MPVHRDRAGLSPQVRGNRTYPGWTAMMGRSIPAGAGEPAMPPGHWATSRVYPRRCGGTRRPPPLARLQVGLSPQVRGNRSRSPASPPGPGSIPAGAGEPRPQRTARHAIQVYPRRCGGTETVDWRTASDEGLSPQVRGNRDRGARLPPRRGSIPAGAGEPRGGGAPPPRERVYPRRCGGTPSAAGSPSGAWGLSPQVRGNRRRHDGVPGRRRSIPAGAGEPRTPPRPTPRRRVYPRRCGGTGGSGGRAGAFNGLSPQVRGNRDRARCG